MNRKISKNVLFLTALATSATLSLGLSNSAYAATNAAVRRPPVKQVAAAPARTTQTVALSMRDFNRRSAALPQLAGLQDGDIVQLSDNGDVTGAIWQGTFVFHPAGSQVMPSAMYARWKDGVVAIQPTPNNSDNVSPGTFDASFIATAHDTPYQLVKTLIKDDNDTSVLRIPENAWLFRTTNNNGPYTALVDVFVYQSGSQPIPVWYPQYVKNGGTDAAPTIKQPVPIAAGTENIQ